MASPHLPVGKRPVGRRKLTASVTIGIEQIIYKASTDAAWKARLLADREAAIHEAGFTLTPSEAVILGSLDDARIALLAERFQPPESGRRTFIKAVAASVVAASTLGVTGCKGEVSVHDNLEGGARPGAGEPDPQDASSATTPTSTTTPDADAPKKPSSGAAADPPPPPKAEVPVHQNLEGGARPDYLPDELPPIKVKVAPKPSPAPDTVEVPIDENLDGGARPDLEELEGL